jgi:hypothetical protein
MDLRFPERSIHNFVSNMSLDFAGLGSDRWSLGSGERVDQRCKRPMGLKVEILDAD